MVGLNVEAIALSQQLTPLQQLTIRTSLLKLRHSSPANTHFSFFARINGTQRDYFILISHQLPTTSLQHEFYWSNDEGLNFAKLNAADLDDFVNTQASMVRGRFTGNPGKKYRDPTQTSSIVETEDEQEEEEEEENQDNDESGSQSSESKKTPLRRLTELERLHHTLTQLLHDTLLIPKGALLLNSTGYIYTNCAFTGLSIDEVTLPSNYLLFRNTQRPSTLVQVRKAGLATQADFLDSVEDENNEVAVWCVVKQSGVSGDGVVGVSVRSLLWPGYELKCEAASNCWSQAYFGTGEKNTDIEFMI